MSQLIPWDQVRKFLVCECGLELVETPEEAEVENLGYERMIFQLLPAERPGYVDYHPREQRLGRIARELKSRWPDLSTWKKCEAHTYAWIFVVNTGPERFHGITLSLMLSCMTGTEWTKIAEKDGPFGHGAVAWTDGYVLQQTPDGGVWLYYGDEVPVDNPVPPYAVRIDPLTDLNIKAAKGQLPPA